jgi:hypothetical protein
MLSNVDRTPVNGTSKSFDKDCLQLFISCLLSKWTQDSKLSQVHLCKITKATLAVAGILGIIIYQNLSLWYCASEIASERIKWAKKKNYLCHRVADNIVRLIVLIHSKCLKREKRKSLTNKPKILSFLPGLINLKCKENNAATKW